MQPADGGASWFLGVNPQRPVHWLPPLQDCHGAPALLWTGDLGLACVLWNCVVEDDAFPMLDRF